MPIVYRCKHCGHPIYVFEHVGQDFYGIPTPSELAARVGGRCPNCGRKLNTKPSIDDVKVW